ALLPPIPERPSYQLQADDPRAFGEQMDAYESAVARHQWAQQQLHAIQQDRAAAEQEARTQEVQREAAALRETLPQWFDDTEGPKLRERAEAIAKGSASNTYHEWQTDSLAAAVGNNKVVEGDDPGNDAMDPTVRLGNYTQ